MGEEITVMYVLEMDSDWTLLTEVVEQDSEWAESLFPTASESSGHVMIYT